MSEPASLASLHCRTRETGHCHRASAGRHAHRDLAQQFDLVELVVESIYVPNRAAYVGGSYEVTNSNLQPSVGEMLVEAALSLLREAATK